MAHAPSPGYSITVRCEIENRIGTFAKIAQAISGVGGDLGPVDIVRVEKGKIIRDITVNARDEAHERQIVKAVKAVDGLKVLRVLDKTFFSHVGGKIEIHNRFPVRDRDDLSKVYTPGVARVCADIRENREHAWRYTIKGNSVAVITDGTAVLGLGNIGPEAAMPVMEGKAMLFKEFGGVDAFPLALATTDPDEIVNTIRNVAVAFGGINLEDISAPRCFDIETRLRRALDIPVFHDDQHGTAVIITAALMNVAKLLKKDMRKMKTVICGAGAAGMATVRMLISSGLKDMTVCDRSGTIYRGRRKDMNPYKRQLAKITNPRMIKGTVGEAMRGAEVFIGLSAPNVITAADISRMSKDPVIFALANPDPEISPEEALPLARVLATGRSDYPNQVNNMLAFPGIFRGLLDARATGVNEQVKFAAALAIARTVKEDELHEDYILPSIFDRKVTAAVARAVSEAAVKTGLARHF